ncbi:MAG: VOC family protein [Rhodococcus sp. (in: high G+C Gram-positive bacteria)]
MTTSLAYLGFEAESLDEWQHYGAQILGFMEVPSADGSEDSIRFRMDDRSYRISIHRADQPGLRHIGLEAANEGEMARIVERLEEHGVDVTRESPEVAANRGVVELVSFRDPAGNLVELSHSAVFDHRPFASPVGVSGFVTEGLGLGHLVLLVAPFQETLDFYTEFLDFRRSDVLNMNGVHIEFLHSNPRHHSLAFGDAFGMNAVAHFMVEARTIDDVGHCLDRFRDAGIEVSMGLGRHGNDQMFSFYGKTPSGFDVEFGYGGILIDDTTWRTAEIPVPSVWGHRPEPKDAAAQIPDLH